MSGLMKGERDNMGRRDGVRATGGVTTLKRKVESSRAPTPFILPR